ncbi:putative PGG domain-containing protein [Rosa chinensis]|uniref:Putative PGG domain-containing protein n=1 Tax=Rosa chinensis TaxID=74649 RepID=A0A2P6PBA0_ROSCH|nr:putative PGG domain-containing protein [Rosa chinensis]
MSNNTMLFSACNLSPLSRLNHIQGASLQMQRELQWFKEVESTVPFEMHDWRDIVTNSTAAELFSVNHKKLMEEAEMSMKGTKTSCTVVGALIVTIMFAVAFTVPGGNNGDTGIPVFIDKKLFMIFIVSDTMSLISSTTSVIIFLGILISRYAEKDFLKSLPTKMMIGLFTLFLAIVAMMVTFSCALIIMLHGKYSWIVLLSILVASVPVSSFVWMQFPLLIETFISTYGPGIFDRKVKPWH